MLKIKVSIMTNKSYPAWKVMDEVVVIERPDHRSYHWEYMELCRKYKTEDDENPVIIIAEEI